MQILKNPYRPSGLPRLESADVARDPAPVLRLLEKCPESSPTPLHRLPALAGELGLDRLWLKDETARMGLGSFKALGAAYVIAQDAQNEDLADVTYVAASAGNHGLSLAAGARTFGASAVVYISETVPERFERRLREAGAEVIRAGADYEDSMAAAERDASENGRRLLSDSSWPGYTEVPRRVMEGYLAIGAEIADQLSGEAAPTHVFLQAGVGGLAAAMAAFTRATWGDEPTVVVVEPESARPLLESIRAGEPVRADGPPSVMGRLDCKEPSRLALSALSRGADVFVAIADGEAEAAVDLLARHGISTTPSGAAGLAAVASLREVLGLGEGSRVVAIVTEGDGSTGHAEEGQR